MQRTNPRKESESETAKANLRRNAILPGGRRDIVCHPGSQSLRICADLVHMAGGHILHSRRRTTFCYTHDLSDQDSRAEDSYEPEEERLTTVAVRTQLI